MHSCREGEGTQQERGTWLGTLGHVQCSRRLLGAPETVFALVKYVGSAVEGQQLLWSRSGPLAQTCLRDSRPWMRGGGLPSRGTAVSWAPAPGDVGDTLRYDPV